MKAPDPNSILQVDGGSRLLEQFDSAWNENGHDQQQIIQATPFQWRDPALIPPRAWLYGRHYIRQFVSATISQSGVGKSTLALAEQIAMASGRNLLGVHIQSALRAWYWNGEDPLEESERRVHALCQHFHIKPQEFADRFFLDTGRTMKLRIAKVLRGETTVSEPTINSVVATIIDNKLDVLTIDPFISSHAVDENSNQHIDFVSKQWADIADATNCAIELIHHVRKPAQGQPELTVEDARGASALVATARSVRVINRMSSAEAQQAHVEDRRFFSASIPARRTLRRRKPQAGFSLYRRSSRTTTMSPALFHGDFRLRWMASLPITCARSATSCDPENTGKTPALWSGSDMPSPKPSTSMPIAKPTRARSKAS